MKCYTTVSRGFCLFAAIGLSFVLGTTAMADAPISGIDSLVFQKADSGQLRFGSLAEGFGGVTFNGFDSIEIDVDAFGGIGGKFYGQFGPAFDASNYQIEVRVKKHADNVADEFSVIMSQHDGGFGSGQEASEDFGFRFLGVNSVSDTEFVTLTRELTLLPNPVTFSAFDPWDTFKTSTDFLDGDGIQDYDANDGGNRNGLWRMQIQSSVVGTDRLHVDIESVRIVPKTAEPEIIRFDGNSGISQETYSIFSSNPIDQSNGNLVIDGTAFGFPSVATRPTVTSFDGTAFAVEVTAKVRANNDLSGFSIIMKDLDGNDTAAGEGAEEWGLFFEETDFNTSTFTTITKPISAAQLTAAQDLTFNNGGDGDKTDFDLYTLAILGDHSGSPGGALSFEFESIKIVPIAVADADFDGDGDIDGADFLAWQRGFGSASPDLANGDANGDGTVDDTDLGIWQDQYGSAAALSAASAVPEPTSLILIAMGFACLAGGRSSRRKSC